MELKGENGVMWEIKDKQSKISIHTSKPASKKQVLTCLIEQNIKIIFINPSRDILLLFT